MGSRFGHHFGPVRAHKDVRKPGDIGTRKTIDALNDAAYMAGLTSELASGHEDIPFINWISD